MLNGISDNARKPGLTRQDLKDRLARMHAEDRKSLGLKNREIIEKHFSVRAVQEKYGRFVKGDAGDWVKVKQYNGLW